MTAGATVKREEHALRAIDARLLGETDWREVIRNFHRKNAGSNEALAVAHNWSSVRHTYEPDELDRSWDALSRQLISPAPAKASAPPPGAPAAAHEREPERGAGADAASHDLAPDLDEAGRFILALIRFDRVEAGECYTSQTFDDSKAKHRELARIFHGKGHATEYENLQRKGGGVFFTINATDGKGREEKNIKRVRAVFVDADKNGAAVLATIKAAGLAPHMIIESSPGKYHIYWFVDREFPLDRFTVLQSALAQKFGTDTNVKDLPRVMRLPGFFHMKNPANPFKVKIVELQEHAPYSLEYIVTALDLALAGAAQKPAPQSSKDVAELDRAVALANATDETIEELRSALAAIPSDDRDLWVRLLHALKPLGECGHELALEWSQKSSKFEAEDFERVWESARGDRTGYAAVFAEAQRRGWANPKSAPPPAALVKYSGKPRTAAALLGAKFQPIKWTVPRILPEGVYLLAAAPKVGKSWLALQIAIAVAGNGEVLGQRAECGSVLYLALEDSDRRLQSRLQKLDAELLLDGEGAGRLHFETRWPRIDEDDGAALDAWLKAHPDARLVIIDVFERFRAPRSPKGNLYSEDYAAMRAIKALADKYRVALLVVHHTKKGEAEDPLELVSGTQGLAGGADGVLVIKRPRGAERGELHVIGRDLADEGAFVVDFQRNTCRWEMVGTTREVAPTAERQAILDALQEAGEPLRLSELAAAVHRSASNTSNMVRKLVGAGAVVFEQGRYRLRNESDESLKAPSE
jgi:hypothetical protein